MREILERIIKHSINAPSGDNLQPWQFGLLDNKIYIINVPEKDQSLYNFNQFGSFIGHGALIENIRITAAKNGYSADIKLFPKGDKNNLVAIMTLSEEADKNQPLFESIRIRTTNRKPYLNELFNDNQRELLKSEINGAKAIFIEDKQKKSTLAKTLSISERLILENYHIHNFLFKHITWTEEEEKEKKSGLYVKTLELNSGQEKAFKVFGNWKLVSILNKIGLPIMFSKQSAILYDKSAAIGLILMPSNKASDFVTAGRLMEEVWLKATKLGLSIQPITAVIFLWQRILAGSAQELTDSQILGVKKAYEIIKDTVGFSKETIGMMFRIGQDGEPSARSTKQPPHILSDNELKKYL